ncbi:MAG: hypothetical protein ACRC3Y_08015 [Romboutsia sp.]|uniref:hypothetical protein n=1 Tax=Romboutsia sp. TaxID=1965302 RepID=UPI003F3E3FE0
MRDPSLKFIAPEDVFQTIEKCDSKKLKVTYCSLTVNGQCMTTKNEIIKIIKIHKNCGFVEGVILRDNEAYEDIILKSSQILSLECVKGGQKPEKPSIFEVIKNCNGLIRLTQCTKLEKGVCKDSKTFNFMVTKIDEKNKNIKGYKLKNNGQPEYMVIDSSVILKVECLSPRDILDNPWSMLPFK